jgi:DNA-binding PadR family transcriptional regulator
VSVLKLLIVWAPLGLLVFLFLSWHPARAQSKAEAALLELLSNEDWWYGLELVRASRGAIKRGTVYVYLGRLEEAGLVLSCLEVETPAHVGIPRRLFRISKLGLQRLESTP